MGPWQELPEWAQELADHFNEGESALFILHGQVFDYIRVNGDYLPFRHFLGHWLAQARQVVFYNLGLGLEFWDAAGGKRLPAGPGAAGPGAGTGGRRRRGCLPGPGPGLAGPGPAAPGHPPAPKSPGSAPTGGTGHDRPVPAGRPAPTPGPDPGIRRNHRARGGPGVHGRAGPGFSGHPAALGPAAGTGGAGPCDYPDHRQPGGVEPQPALEPPRGPDHRGAAAGSGRPPPFYRTLPRLGPLPPGADFPGIGQSGRGPEPPGGALPPAPVPARPPHHGDGAPEEEGSAAPGTGGAHRSHRTPVRPGGNRRAWNPSRGISLRLSRPFTPATTNWCPGASP